MKKIITILVFLVLVSFADRIWSTANLQTTDWLHEPVICLDSANGTPVKADSAHVHVFFGNATDPCYSARITTIPSSWIDSYDYAGSAHDAYWFLDQVADIDADSGAGYYTGTVRMFKAGVPTDNNFDFNLTTGNFDDAVTSAITTGGGRRHVWMSTIASDGADGLSSNTARGSLTGALLACDGSGAVGCIVHVLPGNYPSDSCATVTIDSINISFVGAGAGKTILNQSGATDIFYFNKSGYMGGEIAGFTMLGGGTGDAIEVNDGDGCFIHDNTIVNFTRGIFFGSSTAYAILSNNRVFDSIADGIKSDGDWHVIHDNVVDSLSLEGADGIAIAGSHNAVFHNYVSTKDYHGITTIVGGVQNLIANNFVGTPSAANAYYNPYGSGSYYVGNHGLSMRRGDDTTSTNEEDIYYSPRSANSDSGYTDILSSNLDTLIARIDSLRDMEWGVWVDSIDSGTARPIWMMNAAGFGDAGWSLGYDLWHVNSKMPTDPGQCVNDVVWTSKHAAYLDSLRWALLGKHFDEAQSTGTDSTVVGGIRFGGEGDNYYNGLFLTWIDGNNNGIPRLIVDYIDHTDSGEFVLYPALPNVVSAAETFRILSHVIGERKEGGIVRIYEK